MLPVLQLILLAKNKIGNNYFKELKKKKKRRLIEVL